MNPREAETVTRIFETYLEMGPVHALCRWLNGEGIRPKQHVTRDGRPMGGKAFSRGALFHLLRNRTCLGEITHRDPAMLGLQLAERRGVRKDRAPSELRPSLRARPPTT